MLKIGEEAPDFKLQGYIDGKFKDFALKQFRSKWLVIFFYPLDFTFVCPTEIRQFSKRYEDFKKLKADVVGVSVDSVHSHKAWVEGPLGKIRFPLLSDFHKKMSRDYDVLIDDEGVALRGTFIIDPYGKLRYMVVSDNDVGRSVEETLRVLAALQTGKLCPVEWTPGKKTLN
ncbi:MAG: peroxiredoxin [Candidatus Ryanbacteria bacterium]|nr:peroxiredoxin [Candidatus Ryanbacteria bacterium]